LLISTLFKKKKLLKIIKVTLLLSTVRNFDNVSNIVGVIKWSRRSFSAQALTPESRNKLLMRWIRLEVALRAQHVKRILIPKTYKIRKTSLIITVGDVLHDFVSSVLFLPPHSMQQVKSLILDT
jgi:hypothetical protein